MSDTLMISVSGIRGHVGTDLTPELVARYAAALGAWARSQSTISPPGRQSARRSSSAGTPAPAEPMFARAAAAGLMSVGVDVIDLGMVPTPTVQLAVEHHHAGGWLDPHREPQSNRVERAQVRGPGRDLPGCRGRRRECAPWPSRGRRERVGTDSAALREDPEAIERHLDAILALADDRSSPPSGRGASMVALDCVRGAGATAILPLLERLGCRVSGINLETDGRFPRAPEPVPENLGELGELVREHRADIGLAVDPDVDRLALVDETGTAIGEDYTLAFAVRAVLDGRTHCSGTTPTVVVNLSTSLVVEDAARAGGARLVRAPVGEANVARTIRDERCADRRRRQRRRHAAGAAHRPGRTPRGGLDLASPCHDWGNAVPTRGRVAPVHHRQGKGTPRSGAPSAVSIGCDSDFPMQPPTSATGSGSPGRPLAARPAVGHRADRPADR